MSTHITGININEQVNWTEAGVLQVCIENFTANSGYNASYIYQGDAYVDHNTSRVFIKLITLFFALGVFALGVMSARKGLQQMGVI